MVLTVTIAGVTKTIKRGSLNLQKTANGRTTASFAVYSTDGSYSPAQDANVTIDRDAVRIFGGLIDRPRVSGPLRGAHAVILTAVSAVDYSAYTEWRFVNETLAAGSLASQLSTLVTNYLTGYGVTLDGSQVTGPTLPATEYKYQQLGEVLNGLATLTAQFGEPFVWRISNTKVLRMYQPSTAAAPFNVTTNTPANVVSDIEVESDREHYANRIIVKVPQKTQAGRIESFTGDGSTTTFQLQYTPTKLYGHILVASGGGETLGNVGDGGQWDFDSATNQITRTAGVSAPGETYNLYFDGVFSGEGIAEDAGEIAANGIRERVVLVESVPADATAQSIAEGELAKSIYPRKTVKYQTLTHGLEPGMSQTITVPRRNISGTAILGDVIARDYGRDQLEYQITAVIDASQTNVGRGWQDQYKIWRGDLTGGAAELPTTTVGESLVMGGAAPPFKSVQFNRTGSFGGDAAFIYYEDENSVVCGLDSSIDAVDFESCQVFGQNNHIADP